MAMTDTIAAADLIARNPRVAFHPLSEGQGGVLLHLDTGAYHGINAVGFLVWQLLDEQRGFDQLIEMLRGRVEDAPANLDAEIAGFVSDLRARGLLTISSRGTTN
jgi:hypothetical protein